MILARLHEPIYRRRIAVLSGLITRELRPGDQVLDIGSGGGLLARSIGQHPDCPADVTIRGAEKQRRGGEAVETLAFDGYELPVEDRSQDVTILADVVHHEPEPMRLLREAARVTKRCLIIKDHIPEGPLAHPRICFMDWAANKPYGVPCLYRYFTVGEWRKIYQDLQLRPVTEHRSVDLYPPVVNIVFGRRLQYFAALERDVEAG